MSNPKQSYLAPTRPVSKDEKLSIAILGANPIRRIEDHGTHYLLPSSNKNNVLKEQVTQLNHAFPNAEINLVVGFESERLIKNRLPNVRIIENQNYLETNEVEQLRLVLNNITNRRLLIINNDSLFNFETFKWLDQGFSTTLFYTPQSPSKDDIGVRDNQGYAAIFSYHVDTKWAGITCLEGKELDRLATFCYNTSNRRLFLWEGLNFLISKNSLRTKEIQQGKCGRIKTEADLHLV